jgi:hypothetical protein
MPASRQFPRAYNRRAREKPIVVRSDPAPLIDPPVEVRQLDRKNGRLQRMQRVIVDDDFVFVFGAAAVFAKQPDFAREHGIVGSDRPPSPYAPRFFAG